MVAIKDGKVIVTGTGDEAQYYYASQDDVDDFIARDLTFGEILDENLMQRENINRILYDDQEPVTDDKRVDVATIARNSEIFIYVEPQFVPVNSAQYSLVEYTGSHGSKGEAIAIDGKVIVIGFKQTPTSTPQDGYVKLQNGATLEDIKGKAVSELWVYYGQTNKIGNVNMSAVTLPDGQDTINVGNSDTYIFPE